MRENDIPKMFTHIGKPFQKVVADSNYNFNESHIRKMRDRAIYVVEEPCQLVYDEPGLTFDAPAGRYIWMTIAAGRVVELLAGVTAEALTLDSAYDEALHIYSKLFSLPIEEQRLEIGLAAVRQEMELVAADRYELHLFEYWHEQVQWTLRLDWLGPSAPLRENAYVLVMRWSSESIEDRCMDQVYRKRLAIHGDENNALPMSVWMTQSKEA